MSKTKGFIIGSTIAAALTGGGFLISGVSEQQLQATMAKEGFSSKPIIPVKGDVPTIGPGITVYPDGTRVKITDPPITPKQGLEYLKAHMDQEAQRFNKTLLNIPISQQEYDLYMDFTYQYGTGTWSNSSMLRHLKQGNYQQACESLLKYKYVAKRDCSIRSNNCYGVWTRQKERYGNCMGAQ